MLQDHALTRITFLSKDQEETIDVNDLVWAFFHHKVLYLVDRDHTIYVFEMGEIDPEPLFASLKKTNPNLYIEALAGHRIGLHSLPNTRDYGGMQTEDGRFILPKKLIRSTTLHHCSKEDEEKLLEEYDLKTIVDFRTELEKIAQPDPSFKGVKKHHFSARKVVELDFLNNDLQTKSLYSLLEHTDEIMDTLYADLIDSNEGKQAYAHFFKVLLDQEEGAVLWHCTQGKDRTGVAAMLLLSALNVPKETIYADYLLTNEYLTGSQDDLIERAGQRKDWVDGIKAWSEARKEYLDQAYEKIEANYGTVNNYLHHALGLSDAQIEQLKTKFLV